VGNTAIAGTRVKAAESHAESRRMRAVLRVTVALVDVDDLDSKQKSCDV